MKEVSMHHIDRLPETPLGDSERQLMEKEYVTKEEIKKLGTAVAEDILREIGDIAKETSEHQAHVILNFLNRDAIIGRLMNTPHIGGYRLTRIDDTHLAMERPAGADTVDAITLSDSDLRAFADPIRDAILDHIRTLVPHAYLHLIELETIKKGEQKVKSLKGEDLVLKELRFGKETQERNARAIDRLQALPEKCPFISYAHIARNGEHTKELQHKLPLIDLASLLKQNGDPKKLLQIFLENVRGVRFLIEHDFVISDLKNQNLGYDTERKHGIIFDFDTLNNKDEDERVYISSPHIRPPETRGQGTFPFGEKQTIYELGVSLFEFAETQNLPDATIYQIERLAVDMAHRDPTRRISIKSAEKRLEDIIDHLSQDVAQKKAA